MEGDFYSTKASVLQYVESAKDVNGAELIEQLKPILSAGSNLLEIGSGPGSDWAILNETYQVTGSDYSVEFLDYLQENYPAGDFLQLNAATLNTTDTFDGIYSNKVLHHLKDADLVSSIKRQSEILNENGIICHSFWKGSGDEYFKEMYVNYHLEEELKSLFGKYFDIVSISAYEEFEAGDSLLVLGKKKE
ncbi:class I SAM-dependent methyltransferase [Crocinitomix catalasitica]|uniref:class I SAM-dependent methyltransferase n=1 Tax=Crocinitomix catalasitica TaxID=184607 RepID=UPI00048834B7|nr:class I SAM-dependent methyltransferase [Crocinitomix catalasitica]